jgi:hypothetical protein
MLRLFPKGSLRAQFHVRKYGAAGRLSPSVLDQEVKARVLKFLTAPSKFGTVKEGGVSTMAAATLDWSQCPAVESGPGEWRVGFARYSDARFRHF